MSSNSKILKQNAAKIRKLLCAAGYMNRVRLEFIRQHTGLAIGEVIEALDFVETTSFRLFRQSGQGAAVAWA